MFEEQYTYFCFALLSVRADVWLEVLISNCVDFLGSGHTACVLIFRAIQTGNTSGETIVLPPQQWRHARRIRASSTEASQY